MYFNPQQVLGVAAKTNYLSPDSLSLLRGLGKFLLGFTRSLSLSFFVIHL